MKDNQPLVRTGPAGSDYERYVYADELHRCRIARNIAIFLLIVAAGIAAGVIAALFIKGL